MLKKFKLESLVIGLLLLNIFISHNLDLGIYKHFIIYNDSVSQIYIKKFFESINVLGDSLWYFSISIFLFALLYFIKKNNFLKKYKKAFINIRYYNLFLFLSVLISGIITQIIKHILGRPRPGELSGGNEYALNFFTFDSGFHSFPSGHTTTFFSVALVASLIAPRIKYFFYFLAIFVSFSRVVVGAHFITDIIGGIAIAFIGFKISKIIILKYFMSNSDLKNILKINNNFFLVCIVFATTSFFLAIGSAFDIFFSSLFYFGKNQFLMQSYYIITILFRKVFIMLVIIYIFLLPILSFLIPIKRLYFNFLFNAKIILYIWFLNIFNLIFFINILLKNFWGRARPNEILELDGDSDFTPWYQITSQCESNCSFVSGDASVGFSLIVFYFLIKKEIYLWLALVFGLAIGSIRILEGGHFISDVIISGLVIFLFNFLFYYYYSKKING